MDCLKKGLVPDINVYDAAAWSAPTPLSESICGTEWRSPKFPDFTRGKWDGHSNSPALQFRPKCWHQSSVSNEAIHDRKRAG